MPNKASLHLSLVIVAICALVACKGPVAGAGNFREDGCTAPIDCDDGIPCTMNLCLDGTCTFAPDDNICNNEVACDGIETCDIDQGCLAGSPNTCPPGDLCVGVTCSALDSCHAVGACDPETGICTTPKQPDGTSCDDSNVSTINDICVSGTCTGTTADVCANANMTEIAAGGRFSCAAGNGKLFCWGQNDQGQLGLGDTAARPTPSSVDTSRSWSKVATGLSSTCAVSTSGALYCWGDGGGGQLGLGSNEDRNVPTRVGNASDWQDVAVGVFHTCGLRNGGALYCWGNNGRGELGINSSGIFFDTPQAVGGGSVWAQISLGMNHSCAIRTDGSLWCWGDNGYGKLGLGDGTLRRVPTSVSAGPWQSITAGGSHTCAVRTNGDLYCWGFNNGNTLGLGDSSHRTSPVRVTAGPSDWRNVSASEVHTCGTAIDGSLWCWGLNVTGILGLGDGQARELPTRVGSGTNWTRVALSHGLHTFGGFNVLQSCGLQADGRVYCWGGNRDGQLGVGDLLPRLVPARIECNCFNGVCGLCGDGICKASDNELCTTCQSDCRTRATVCGNGECQAGETPSNCEADCGFSSRPSEWSTLETQVMNLINQRRTAGYTCPSGPKPAVAALSFDSSLQNAARLHAWDLSNAEYFSHTSCNDREPMTRASAVGSSYHGEIIGAGYGSAQDVVNGWLASDGHCVILMGASHTAMGAGYATEPDFDRGYGTERWVTMFK